LEDQLHGLRVRDLLTRGEQAFLISLAANRGKIQAAAVIAHFDDDLRALALDL